MNIKNLKTFTGYIELKLSSFRLSDYSIIWIEMEKKRLESFNYISSPVRVFVKFFVLAMVFSILKFTSCVRHRVFLRTVGWFCKRGGAISGNSKFQRNGRYLYISFEYPSR